MRILMLAPYPPFPPQSGGALRIYNLVRGLSIHHEVWCLTCVADDEQHEALQPLRGLCRVVTVRGLLPRSIARRAWSTLTARLPDMALRNASPAYGAALQTLVQGQRFDVVQAESIEMGNYGLMARSASSKPLLVLDEFNAEYVLQRRAALTDLQRTLRSRSPRALVGGSYSLVQWRKLLAYERSLLQAYDRVLAVSSEDRTALHKIAPRTEIDIIPNGVDTTYFNAARRPTSGWHDLVFTGTLNFRPNIDAVLWFANEVFPRIKMQQPDARFVIVGKNPSPAILALHTNTDICVHSNVPDVRPFIAEAAAYVVPMRMGGGVRLKVLEALSMQVPVISTSMGAEGVEGGYDGTHVVLADDAAQFARRVVDVINDSALAQRLGAAGRQLALERYDWRVIVPRLEQIYKANRSGARVAAHHNGR